MLDGIISSLRHSPFEAVQLETIIQFKNNVLHLRLFIDNFSRFCTSCFIMGSEAARLTYCVMWGRTRSVIQQIIASIENSKHNLYF